MSDEPREERLPTDRESPVGAPVIRGDPSVTGQKAKDAVQFDPDDPESLELAAETVLAFSQNTAGSTDNVFMLRGAAACAALVRGVGSYKEAAERAGEGVTVSFIRKWARVHDLPHAIRRHVARGNIPPTAAKHIARVSGQARFHLAFATLDHNLTVREVRSIATDINDGVSPEEALRKRGYTLGEVTITISPDLYCEVHRNASLDDTLPGAVIEEALSGFFTDQS